MGFLFKKNGQDETHLKKWVVVFFHLFLPVLFGSWGIFLSIAANKNREQIDTLTKMMAELKDQNGRLQTLIELHNSQLTAYLGEVKYNKRPFLRASLDGGNLAVDTSELFVKITNTGGDITNLTITPVNGAKVDNKTLPNSRAISAGSEHILRIHRAKTGKIAILNYTDILRNRFSQDLFWQYENGNIHFGAMKEMVK